MRPDPLRRDTRVVLLPIVAALLSAVLYGAGVAVQHRQAAQAPAEAAGRPRLLLLLVSRPWWLAGVALEWGGFAAHAVALRTGTLSVVQTVLSCSLLVSLAGSGWPGHRRWNRGMWLAVIAVIAGVGGTVALLRAGAPHAGDGRLGWAAFAVGALAVPAALLGLLTSGRSRPALLAVAAGLGDAFVAVVTMAFVRSFGHGAIAAVTSWPALALAVGGLGAVLLTQTAYQANAPLITLPVITVVTPMASVVLGCTVLGEIAHPDAIRVLALAACAVVMATALVALSGGHEMHDPVDRVTGEPAAFDEHHQVRHGLVDRQDLVEQVEIGELALAARPGQ